MSAIVESGDGGVVVRIHVLPTSGRTEIVGRHGDALKVRVTAPPVDGRATDAARIAVADALGIPPYTVIVVAGERSRFKQLRIAGLEVGEVQQRLAPWIGPPRG
ncbi:MAG: uncharacterized protein QOG65_581 [Actinomycetota bacterium]|nr:uncharacterized protein [Actinomycetota bacterium]